jgi:CDP-glucose 4,6-dehydratase
VAEPTGTVAMLGLEAEFWRGRRVLVTGHTGFKGGWLSLWLQTLGADVSGYALPPPTTPSLFEAARVADGMRHAVGDLRNPSDLERAMGLAAPAVVFHLAAQPLVREGYRDPAGTVTSNVVGTMNVLEAVRRQPSVKAVVVVTSDKCYANREWPWPYRENDALGGKDPYSASKACTELLAAAWRDSFLDDRVALATARAGNVVGGGDWAPDRLVPDALRAWQAGEPVAIRYPQAVRPWQHVLEPLAGYLLLARRLLEGGGGEAWNFGPPDGDAMSVGELVDTLAALWGPQAHRRADPAPQPPEAGQLRLDSSKARSKLGWRSRYGTREALALVVAWQRAWLDGEDMRAFSLRQIDDYMTQDDER